MILLEITGGQKNYGFESSGKPHFPLYTLKTLEEGKLREIVDRKLDTNENDERFVVAIKFHYGAYKEEMQLRPRMSKVVQMLECLCDVPDPPFVLALYRISSNGRMIMVPVVMHFCPMFNCPVRDDSS
ncbi:S-domain-2 5 [Euphorbia peplus]|nr:S-domain-2 5 [Euphorbia peplus]